MKTMTGFRASQGRVATAVAITLLVLLFLPGLAGAYIDAALQMQLGNPTGATTNSTNNSNYLVVRTVQALDFANMLGEPRWGSWDLTSGDIGSAPRSTSFYVDSTLPTNFYRVKTTDYNNSGYDRGHMCTSEDRTDTTNNNKLVFYMSNIVPQTPDNNQGPWASFENYCQAQALAGYEILIVSGPVSFDGSTLLNSNKVWIPGNIWKIAVVVPSGGGSALSRITTSTRVISVKMPNVSGIRSTPWTNYIVAASQIQSDTAYTFFTALSADIAEVLLAKVDGAPAPALSSFSPAAAGVGMTVTITGSNFTGASKVKFNGTAATFTVDSATQISATVPSGATSGLLAVIAPGGLATSTNSFTVGVGKVVVSQVYGGGGNAGAPYKNDFIELYNSGVAPVSLATYSVQYASATSSNWTQTTLSGTLNPGHYYLVQEYSGGTNGVVLPTPQATGTINLAATAGKVALTKTQTLLTVSNPLSNPDVVDFVGFGTTANAYEGAGPAPAPSNTAADLRAGAGATDTNNNNSDFSTGSPNPRNN